MSSFERSLLPAASQGCGGPLKRFSGSAVSMLLVVRAASRRRGTRRAVVRTRPHRVDAVLDALVRGHVPRRGHQPPDAWTRHHGRVCPYKGDRPRSLGSVPAKNFRSIRCVVLRRGLDLSHRMSRRRDCLFNSAARRRRRCSVSYVRRSTPTVVTGDPVCPYRILDRR